MKKLPTTFILMALILFGMFFFISKMMSKAQQDLKKIEVEREKTGGSNDYERELNSLMK